jgi:hypothetical protein
MLGHLNYDLPNNPRPALCGLLMFGLTRFFPIGKLHHRNLRVLEVAIHPYPIRYDCERSLHAC